MRAVESSPVESLQPVPDVEDQRPGGLPLLCPFLVTRDGTWRGTRPLLDHRCAAVSPAVPLALEKQRRLCLGAGHLDCSTYLAATEGRSRVAESRPGSRLTQHSRPVARMSPIVLDQPRFEFEMPALRRIRTSGQAVLVAVLSVALAVIVLGRPTGEPGLGGTDASSPQTAAPAVASDPIASPPALASARSTTPAATAVASAAGSPSSASSTPAPSVSPAASATAEPSLSGATYKVQRGDNLSAIAARFGTTVKRLVELNGIADPTKLKIGQVLILP